MAIKIVWTPEADREFDRIIAYLLREWSENEVLRFVQTTDRIIDHISEYPKMFRKTDKRNVHEALITKHNLMAYKIFKNHIAIITFWDTRQDPKTKKY